MGLTHFDSEGNARMVDVSAKPATQRRAVAQGFVRLTPEHLNALHNLPKGNAVTVAQVAGVMAAKRTGDLIPLCHPLPLTHASVELYREDHGVRIVGEATTVGQAGVEMEALTAVSVAALTLYDMVKALGPDIIIEDIKLIEKTGGKKDWKRT